MRLLYFLCPAGTGFRRPTKLGRLRGVRQGGAGYGLRPLHPDAKSRLRALGRHRRRCRRAVSHENQSITARQSRDLLLISSRVDVPNTPSGLRPFCPLASPQSTPVRAFSTSLAWRGPASCAAGASLTRCAHSGNLPPRRINARFRFRSGQNPFQPNTAL